MVYLTKDAICDWPLPSWLEPKKGIMRRLSCE